MEKKQWVLLKDTRKVTDNSVEGLHRLCHYFRGCAATGPRSPIFVPEAAFEALARRQIARLRPACLQAVELVLAELQRLLPACMPPQVQRYAALHDKLHAGGRRALARRQQRATEMVNSLIDMELAYLNTAHPDFVGGSQAMRLMAAQSEAHEYNAESGTVGPRSALATPDSAASLRAAYTPPPPPAAAAVPPPSQQHTIAGYDVSDLTSFFGTGEAKKPPPPEPSASASPFAEASPMAAGLPAGLEPARAGMATPAADGYAGRSREQLEVEIIRSLLVSYYGIVRKNLADAVPKAIMHFLVNSVRQNVQNELVAELYKEGEFDATLRETDDAVRRREDCFTLVNALERAQRVVDELRVMDGSSLDHQ